MVFPPETEQLRTYLSERAAFYIVWRVLDTPGKDLALELLCGASAFGDRISELAAGSMDTALNCCRLGANGLMPFDPTRPPNPEGRRWRGYIVATGPTRTAGYVVLFKALAMDEAEMRMYAEGVQRVMQGEQARNVPRPGDW